MQIKFLWPTTTRTIKEYSKSYSEILRNAWIAFMLIYLV